jgi:hypothetical protein
MTFSDKNHVKLNNPCYFLSKKSVLNRGPCWLKQCYPGTPCTINIQRRAHCPFLWGLGDIGTCTEPRVFEPTLSKTVYLVGFPKTLLICIVEQQYINPLCNGDATKQGVLLFATLWCIFTDFKTLTKYYVSNSLCWTPSNKQCKSWLGWNGLRYWRNYFVSMNR